MKEQFSLGTINYRYPNAIEAMDLSLELSSLGEKATKIDYMKCIISNMENLVSKVAIEVNGSKIKSFSKLMECPNVKCASALMRISGVIYDAMFTSEAEKKQ